MSKYVRNFLYFLAVYLATTFCFADGYSPNENLNDSIINSDSYNVFSSQAIPSTKYVGPGDVLPASTFTNWYSCTYGISYAYASLGTNKACNIRRTSDGTNKDIVILSTGLVDVATAASFCAITTCFVTKAYDQSGNNRDLVETTTAKQPMLQFNCTGPAAAPMSLPCISYNGSQDLVSGNSEVVVSQPVSMSVVAERTGGTASDVGIMSNYNFPGSGSRTTFGAPASSFATNAVYIYDGTGPLPTTAADNSFHAYAAIFHGSSSGMTVDGSNDSPLTLDSGTSNQAVALGSKGDKTGQFTGLIAEGGQASIAFTAAQTALLCNNQQPRYNTTICNGQARLLAIGDSIAYGVGSSPFPNESWFYKTASALGLPPTQGNFGVSGTTSTQIASTACSNLSSVTHNALNIVILEGGYNDFAGGGGSPSTVESNYATMVGCVPSGNNYLIFDIQNTQGQGTGTSIYTNITTTNSALASSYPSNYIPIRECLIAGCTIFGLTFPSGLTYEGLTPSSTDTADIANDIVPDSLRYSGQVHENNYGQDYVAHVIASIIVKKGW